MADHYKQGQNDASKGKGPANTNTWSSAARQKYDAGYKYQQDQNNKKK